MSLRHKVGFRVGPRGSGVEILLTKACCGISGYYEQGPRYKTERRGPESPIRESIVSLVPPAP